MDAHHCRYWKEPIAGCRGTGDVGRGSYGLQQGSQGVAPLVDWRLKTGDWRRMDASREDHVSVFQHGRLLQGRPEKGSDSSGANGGQALLGRCTDGIVQVPFTMLAQPKCTLGVLPPCTLYTTTWRMATPHPPRLIGPASSAGEEFPRFPHYWTRRSSSSCLRLCLWVLLNIVDARLCLNQTQTQT